MLLVVVRVPGEVPLDPYLSYVDELGAALSELEEIDYVDYSLGDIETLSSASSRTRCCIWTTKAESRSLRGSRRTACVRGSRRFAA